MVPMCYSFIDAGTVNNMDELNKYNILINWYIV